MPNFLSKTMPSFSHVHFFHESLVDTVNPIVRTGVLALMHDYFKLVDHGEPLLHWVCLDPTKSPQHSNFLSHQNHIKTLNIVNNSCMEY